MEQRARLAAKGSPMPHQLTMTATPIPRTLALMEHGDLALTAIDELPKGRQPVATHLHVNSTAGWDQVIASAHALAHAALTDFPVESSICILGGLHGGLCALLQHLRHSRVCSDARMGAAT